MTINFNLLDTKPIQFFQEQIFQPLTTQNKKIAIVATMIFGLLAAWYLISYCCHFKAKVVEDKHDDENPSTSKNDHSPENASGIPVEPSFTDEEMEEKRLAAMKEDEAKQRERMSNDIEKKWEEIETLLPTDETEKQEEKEEKKEIKRTAVELARGIELHAEITTEAIDQMLQDDKELSEDDKKQLLAEKDRHTKLKDVAQQIVEFEKKKKADLEEEITKKKQKLIEYQEKSNQAEQKVAEEEKEIETVEREIKEKIEKVQRLSQGTYESDLASISYQPDQIITLPSGDQVKASDYVGKLDHELKLDKCYTLMSEDQASHCDLKGKYVAVLRGREYQLKDWGPIGSKIHYYFRTNWEGKGVLPEIKITWLTLNEEYYYATIINTDADIRQLQKRIPDLQRYLDSSRRDQAFWQERIERVQKELEEAEAKLKEIGDPK